MLKLRPSTLALAAALTLGLSACGGNNEAGDGAQNQAQGGAARTPGGDSSASAPAMSIAEGPDVCFRAIAKHLGPDVKVAKIQSFFSSGSDINPNDKKPAGELTTCSVEYQNPQDPRKLLSTNLDTRTGAFAEARPLEISVMGNAKDFNLEDHLIPLSQVKAAPLAALMEAQKAKLDGAYSKYVWDGVRLMGPDMSSSKHVLRIDVEGRLKSNDIKETGYAEVSIDGAKIVNDHLTPR